MTVHLKQRGDYELYLTDHQNRILALDGERFFAWVETQQGELLVRSNPGHRKERTLRRGRFYFADFEHEPKFKDMPHLFLQRDDRFEELMLPNGLPTDADPEKKIVKTDETLAVNELEKFVEQPERGGKKNVEGRKETANAPAQQGDGPSAGGGPIAESAETHRRQPESYTGSQAMQTRETFSREGFKPEGEESRSPAATAFGGTQTVRPREERATGEQRTFREEGQPSRPFGQAGAQADLPIHNFNELSVKVARKRLENLSRDELRRLREFEEGHKNRKTMLEAIDRRLGEAPRDAARKSAGTSW